MHVQIVNIMYSLYLDHTTIGSVLWAAAETAGGTAKGAVARIPVSPH